MQQNGHPLFEPSVPQEVRVPMQRQPQLAQNVPAHPANLTMHVYQQPGSMMHIQCRESLGMAVHEPPHPISTIASLLENPMSGMASPPNTYSHLGVNAGTGSATGAETLGLQVSSPTPAQILPLAHVNPIGMRVLIPLLRSNSLTQQQPVPRGGMQALVADRTNESAGPVDPEATGDTSGERWTGTLRWQQDGAWVQAQALAIEGFGNPMRSTWPELLQLDLVMASMFTLDIQAWILKTKAPVVRIKCPSGMANHEFDALVRLLRNGRGYAVARWEIGGCTRERLLLAPFGEYLLCTAFILSGISEPPTSLPRQPGPTKQRATRRPRNKPRSQPSKVVPTSPESLCEATPSTLTVTRRRRNKPRPQPRSKAMPTSSQSLSEATPSTLTPQPRHPHQCTQPEESHRPIDAMESSQGDLIQTAHTVAVAPIHAMFLPQPRLGGQAYSQAQGQPQQPQVQQSPQPASSDMIDVCSKLGMESDAAGCVADSSDLPGPELSMEKHNSPWFGIGEHKTSHVDADIDLVSTDSEVSGLSAGLGLGGDGVGPMHEVGGYTMRHPGEDDMDQYMDWEGNGGGHQDRT